MSGLISGSIENNVALINLKFDFSLMKVDAPTEFSAIGSALSSTRRTAAEEGPLHRTARKLGALFEQLVPSTPKLISAYGLRLSEIIQKPGVNPVGGSSHGPFRKYVGADGTAIWAAASSGISALGVYLLSCMLARAWDAKESVALWVELVAARREEILQAAKNNEVVSDTSCYAVRQDIARQDLALWDASTRSWLRSADQAKVRELDQLMLILKNISIPYNTGSSTYSKVIKAWLEAMTGMENLLCGRPQNLSNASMLLALRAWHLFPDLLVLGAEPTNVKFKDPLLPSHAIGTIGLQSNRPMHWSLALSHYSHYGAPIVVESREDFSRVTIDQLHIVALGSLFGIWNVRPKEVLAAAEWLVELWEYIEPVTVREPKKLPITKLCWLRHLTDAARSLSVPDNKEREVNLSLLKFGQRRGKTFLCDNAHEISPFFGLLNSSVLHGLAGSTEADCGIRYLRDVAQRIDLKDCDALILCIHSECSDFIIYEYATAIPHATSSGKRDAEGNSILELRHARWVAIEPTPTVDCRTKPTDKVHQYVQSVIDDASRQGEMALHIQQTIHRKMDILSWEHPPIIYRSGEGCPSMADRSPCRCLEAYTTARDDCFPNCTDCHTVHFSSDIGNHKMALYYVDKRKRDSRDTDNTRLQYSAHSRQKPSKPEERPKLTYVVDKQAVMTSVLCLSSGMAWLKNKSIHRDLLYNYMCCTSHLHIPTMVDMESSLLNKCPVGTSILSASHHLSKQCIISFVGLSIADLIYRKLEGATIALTVVANGLHRALWLPKDMLTNGRHAVYNFEQSFFEKRYLSRAQTFACIAHLESGTKNIDPRALKETIVMCSDNSMFVSGIVLSDPLRQSRRVRRQTYRR